MKLESLTCEGFRSLVGFQVDFDLLTILIGENDAGKSSVLDLLDIVLGGKQPDQDDFYLDPNEQAVNQIEVTLGFQLDEESEAEEYSVDACLRVRWLFYRAEKPSEVYYWGEKPEDEKLALGISHLNASDQKERIEELAPSVEPSEISNQTKRLEWFDRYIDSMPKVTDWLPAPRSLNQLLPRFERYSAMDYNNPAGMVGKTLRQVYEQTIFEEIEDGDTTRLRLIEPLRKIQKDAKRHIHDKVQELEDYIQQYNNLVRGISYEPVFDFSTSLKGGEFMIDCGRGQHAFSKLGDGTKRRMFMAVLEWDRNVLLEQVDSGEKLPSIIRGYDEPDTNLHYGAQRRMYKAISDVALAPNSHIQALLCTHSLTMIDRAPAPSIRLLTFDNKGHTKKDQIETDDDPEVEKFLIHLANELGISNSLIFYERCFILVEGDTEDNALPITYRREHGYSMFEDCIRIINVRSNGAIKEFLKFLSRNRQSLTLERI